MSENEEKIISNFKANRVILPILLGLGIVAWFIYRDFNKIDFSLFQITSLSFVFLFSALGMMFFRDFGYVLRMRVLSEKQLSWKQCIKIVFLWEFGSAITPSAVGGTALATLFLWKEGLNAGKSTSIVLATSFLDELYFSLMFPVIIMVFSKSQIFITSDNSRFVSNLFGFAMAGYTAKLAWTLLMAYSLFINPKFLANLLKVIFKIKFLKRWRLAAEQTSLDFETANREYRTKGFKFWVKSFVATFISWTARYWVLNFLLVGMMFSIVGENSGLKISEHLLIFARQLVMWIIMLVMPTPGGSGFVETVFASFMSDFVPVSGFVIIMALIWRMVTYYPYLIIGAIIAPGWLNKNFRKKSK